MASFEHPSSAITSTIIVATSADLQAQGNAASFKHPIRQFVVDDPQMYQIALVDITFDHPGTGPVYVSCNLVALTRVGSQMVNTLYRIGTHTAGTTHILQTGSIVLYYPYAAITTADSVEIALTDSAGQPIPASGTTTVTLSIKRI